MTRRVPVNLRSLRIGLAIVFVALALGSSRGALATDATWIEAEDLGGAFTVYSYGQSSYNRMPTVLGLQDRHLFSEGATAFRQVQPTNDRSTLRPRNANSCETCHVRNGRGLVDAQAIHTTGFSVSSNGYAIRVNREPSGGAHARLERVHWRRAHKVKLPGGLEVQLMRPVAIIDGVEKAVDLRNAPSVYGLGLLEAIPDIAIRRRAAALKQSNPAIAGTVVSSALDGKVGRFGWKGRFSTLPLQVRTALIDELGRSSSDRGFEDLAEKLTNYMRLLAVPARRIAPGSDTRQGARLFEDIGCAGCHEPAWQTGSTVDVREDLRGQWIYPYSDLLLHDMGEGLRDANDNEQSRFWRTPPLWGIGVQASVSRGTGFLHDGRARTLTEAILWHEGEAALSTRRFEKLTPPERKQLLAFLSSL